MQLGTTEKTVISVSKKKSKTGAKMAEVVYKTYEGKHKSKSKFSSKTRHEPL